MSGDEKARDDIFQQNSRLLKKLGAQVLGDKATYADPSRLSQKKRAHCDAVMDAFTAETDYLSKHVADPYIMRALQITLRLFTKVPQTQGAAGAKRLAALYREDFPPAVLWIGGTTMYDMFNDYSRSSEKVSKSSGNVLMTPASLTRLRDVMRRVIQQTGVDTWTDEDLADMPEELLIPIIREPLEEQMRFKDAG